MEWNIYGAGIENPTTLPEPYLGCLTVSDLAHILLTHTNARQVVVAQATRPDERLNTLFIVTIPNIGRDKLAAVAYRYVPIGILVESINELVGEKI
jgi:hypothetical protein